MLIKTVESTIQKYNMIEDGDTVVVGLSGGADSVSLLYILVELRSKLHINLQACHVNHMLRGAESDGDEAFVAEMCSKLDVPLTVYRFDTNERSAFLGKGVEETARLARYEYFAQAAGDNSKIATAHTLSDSAETMLFNLMRGTGIKGMCGIPYIRDNIIRPMRDCTREDIESYLHGKGVSYRHDASNDTDDYTRNFIRHNIVPQMKKLNPALETTLSRTMIQLADQCKMTEDIAKSIGVNSDGSLSIKDLQQLPQPARRFVLKDILEKQSANISEKMILLMESYIFAENGAVEIKKGVRFVVKRGYAKVITDVSAIAPFNIKFNLPTDEKPVFIDIYQGKKLKVCKILQSYKKFDEKFYNMYLTNLARCDRIAVEVFVCQPTLQDSMMIQDKMQKLFFKYRAGTKGKTTGEISRMLVVHDDTGVVWAEAIGTDENRRPKQNGEDMYFFECVEENN